MCIIIVIAVLYFVQISAGNMNQYSCDSPKNIPETTEDVQFLLYNRDNLLIPIELKYQNGGSFDSTLIPENPTIIYIHGFTQHVSSKSSQEVKDAYMLCGTINVIMVDWGKLGVYPYYSRAVQLLPMVGKYTAQLIKHLDEERMISIPNLHIIGNSLGAHISGIVGEELAKLGTEKIGRITGLDPAGPLFEKRTTLDGMLDAGDATFVDIIHTDTRLLGIRRPIGHVDFYVNGGKSQPGCNSRLQLNKGTKALVACSHRRAREYYIESILNPHGFPALKCEKFPDIDNYCEKDEGDIMGFGTNSRTRGIFAVKTRSNYPFATQTSSYSKIVPCGITPTEHINSTDHPLSDVIPVTKTSTEINSHL